jgi:glycosyltransferase involved in cell wall biosynthesis
LKKVANNSTLAVIPIKSANPVAWRKSENKLLGLWALGVPVLASPTPSYARVLSDASLSQCLVEDSDWEDVIVEISKNQKVLNEMSEIGHRYAVARTNGITLDKLWKASFNSIGLTL